MVRRPAWMPNPETIIEDLLAAQSNKRSTYGPRDLEWNQNISIGHARGKARRREAAWAKREVATPAKESATNSFIKQMTPGHWYGLNTVADAAGVRIWITQAVELDLRNRGLVERCRNPAWIPHGGKRGRTKGPIPKGLRTEPKWLYRLTAAGEARRLAL